MNTPIVPQVHTQTATERIYMGQPAAEAIAAEMARVGNKRAYIISSKTLATKTDAIERIQKVLGERYAGLFTDMAAHGSRASVLAAAAGAREAGADVLVSIGGGSVVDSTKVVSICLKHNLTKHEDLDAYKSGLDEKGNRVRPVFEPPTIRTIAVPTTLSGAEFHEAGALTDERIPQKQGYGNRMMVPRAIVLDPAITVHTPMWLWISTGVRALDHALETLGAPKSNPYCDALAEAALRTLAETLPRTMAAPDDLDARLRSLVAGWQTMIALSSGVPLGISHAVGHVLGGTFGVAHGHTSCVTAPQSLAYNASVNAQGQKRISAAFGDASKPAHVLVDQFIRSLGMPRTLGEVGLKESDIPKLADGVMLDTWTYSNPRKIDNVAQVREFLATLL